MHQHHQPALRHSHPCGPSRLIWFTIGAVVSACWIRYKEARCGYAVWSQHCTRASIQLPGVPCLPDTPFSWIHRDIPKAINNTPLAETWEDQSNQWSEEKEFLSAIGRRAADEITSWSETALDKVLCSALVLKAKLARRRVERERDGRAHP